MGFRLRLALFLVLTLAAVQGLTAWLVYTVTRSELIAAGQRQLSASAQVFVRQIDDVAERVADSVEVLALDYALRSAIAQKEQTTVRSALRNHGRRVGAARMLLIELDGQISADTGAEAAAPRAFPFPRLLGSALERRSAEVVALEERAYWMVVVPVLAPQPIAFIAAGIPIDDALLARMQQVSALPSGIELLAPTADGGWSVLARSAGQQGLTGQLFAQGLGLPDQPQLVTAGGHEYVALAVALGPTPGDAPLMAVLSYSLDEALRPYRSVATSWAVLLGMGLLFAMLGAVLIAHGVSRPLIALAATARRIAGGDYSAPPVHTQRDEIGQLSQAFSNMAQAIGEREERIRHQLDHDAVTGLPNRVAAENAIQQLIIADANASGALLMIGLGRLSEIVQTMGHALADRLMRHVGARMQALARERLVARATDTQFLIWLPAANRSEAITVAFRLVDALDEPYQEADVAIDLAPAIGIALMPEHGRQAGELLRHAEVSLLLVQESEEPVSVYVPETDPHRPERLSLMADLREALEHDQLELHYQPKLHLGSLRVDGAEGLVRWHHRKHGMIPPDAFIALAEKTGNIRQLTRWALATSIAQAQRWSRRGNRMRVAVNLSVRDLKDAELPRRISELLSLHQLPPDLIMLEITESAVMGEPDAAIAVLRRLADQGIDLAIDDFGVGQSSFAYLRRLPVREIKIDKSFVQRLATDAGDQAIVSSIVDLGHRLGYRVTCEGVESQAALDYLVAIGCDHAQGYCISRALPLAEFDRFVGHAGEPIGAAGGGLRGRG